MGIIEEKGWVSLIVPCYNGERFIERFIKNIAEQTYKKIDLIFIDDGSKDKTRELFVQFRYLLENSGMRCEYYYQENRGQAAAINTALPKVTGEYCSWLDVDDSITKDHIQKKVKKLAENENAGAVICKGIAVSDRSPTHKLGDLSIRGHLGCPFEDILFDYMGCEPGLYMVRSELLFKALGGRHIYPSRVGQNFQLLLPIIYQFKLEYIDEVLFFYRVRPDSHSHCIVSEADWKKRIELVEDVKKNILMQMILPETYLQVLLELLKYKILKWKMDKMVECSEENNITKFASDVLSECFLNLKDVSKKELWIWGETENNYKLVKLIELDKKATVKGFVDSNEEKVKEKFYGRDVISPQSINANTMVLLIPLMIHKEIGFYLEQNGFCAGKNYFYPEYEIARRLEEFKNEIC